MTQLVGEQTATPTGGFWTHRPELRSEDWFTVHIPLSPIVFISLKDIKLIFVD